MGWRPWPVLPKKQWPKVEYGTKRAITAEEHQRIIRREPNPERRLFYELSWLVGGSQGDLAHLNAEDINWDQRVISYRRQKSKTMALMHFGEEVAALLRQLPSAEPLFPYLRRVRAGDRATEFKPRCREFDKVRPGGLLLFITSRGTLDKQNGAVREYVASQADLLGAIRLPNDTFKKNANHRHRGVAPATARRSPGWPGVEGGSVYYQCPRRAPCRRGLGRVG